MNSYTDNDLLTLIQADDAVAFNLIVERYRTYLILLAIHHLGDHEDAQDIIQEVFISLWNQRKKAQITVGIKTYLAGMVRKKCIDLFRKVNCEKKRQYEQEQQQSITVPMTPIEVKELGKHLDAAITKLSPARRKAFEQRYKDQKSIREIALFMGIQTQAVKNHISEALKHLRKELQYI